MAPGGGPGTWPSEAVQCRSSCIPQSYIRVEMTSASEMRGMASLSGVRAGAGSGEEGGVHSRCLNVGEPYKLEDVDVHTLFPCRPGALYDGRAPSI